MSQSEEQTKEKDPQPDNSKSKQTKSKSVLPEKWIANLEAKSQLKFPEKLKEIFYLKVRKSSESYQEVWDSLWR